MSTVLADLQTAVVTRLRETPAVTALVPQTAITDGYSVPQAFPAISLGEDQQQPTFATLSDGSASDVIVPIHIWTRSSGMIAAKRITGALLTAFGAHLLVGSQSCRLRFAGARFARDADGVTQRATVLFRARVFEVS